VTRFTSLTHWYAVTTSERDAREVGQRADRHHEGSVSRGTERGRSAG
jgi:hypothetical protein